MKLILLCAFLAMAVLPSFGASLKRSISKRYTGGLTLADRFEAPLEYNSRKYYLSKEAVVRLEVSETICNVYGGYLAEMNDADEMAAITDFLQAKYKSLRAVMLDGTDRFEEGTWVVVPYKEDVPYLEWAGGEPNDYKGNPNGENGEDCIVTNWLGQTKMWDYNCEPYQYFADYRFLCEVPW